MIKLISSIILFFLFNHSFVINAQEVQNMKLLNVGLYVEDVHGIDYQQAKYEVVIWVWINSKDGIYNFEEDLDIPNSTHTEISSILYDSLETGEFHSECKIRATILNKFDVKNYPFDRQRLKFLVEFSRYSAEQINITIDKKQSKLIPEYIEDWITKSYSAKVVSNDYGSNFGDLHTKESISYPGISLEINLARNSWNLYYKSFITLFLSFCLASLSFFYPNEHSEEKIGLIVGSLFTTVGNKYVTDEILPIQNSLNLSDKLHLLTILIITLIAAHSIFEQRMKIKDSLRTDLFVYFLFLVIFCSGIFYFTYNSIQ
jgi:hypothetical protein